MNHDVDFIREAEAEDSRTPPRSELTGWEVVIFEIADEEERE